MDLKNSPSSNGPSKVILVTGAVCLSVLLAAISYKITLSQSEKLPENLITGFQGTTTASENLISNALQDAELNSINNENATSTNPFAIQSGDNVSDRLTKTIFTGYLYAEQVDGVSDTSINNVNNAVFSQINKSDLPTQKFLASQIRIFVPNSKDQLKQYGNSLAEIIIKNYKIINDNKAQYTDNISELAKIFRKIGNEVSLQNTPIEMQVNQANLANSYYVSGQAMDMVAAQDKDPVKAMLGLKVTKEMNLLQENMLINIASYLNKNDIIFSSTESGSLWNQYMSATNDQTTQETSAGGN